MNNLIPITEILPVTGEVDKSKLAIDENSQRASVFLDGIKNQIPYFLKHNFNIELKLDVRGGAEFDVQEPFEDSVIRLRITPRQIGEIMALLLTNNPETAQAISNYFGLPINILIDQAARFYEFYNPMTIGEQLISYLSETYPDQILEATKLYLKNEAQIFSSLHHEYAHLVMGDIKNKRNLTPILRPRFPLEQENQADKLLMSINEKYDLRPGGIYERQVIRQASAEYFKKLQSVIPEFYEQHIKFRHLIILEEIVIDLGEAAAKGIDLDAALTRIENGLFRSRGYLSWNVLSDSDMVQIFELITQVGIAKAPIAIINTYFNQQGIDDFYEGFLVRMGES